MRKALLMLVLLLTVTTLTPSQSLQEALIEISTELSRLSKGFDSDLLMLEENLSSLRSDSTQTLDQHSTQLADLESEAASSADSLTELRTSQQAYQTYVQTTLQTQAEEIRRLQIERWVYRVAIGILTALTVKELLE